MNSAKITNEELKVFEETLDQHKKKLERWEKNLRSRETNILDKTPNDGIINLKLDNLVDYNKQQDEDTLSLHKIIHGNGNPEQGHATRLTRLEERVKTLFSRNKVQLAVAIAILSIVIKLAFWGG